MLIRNARDVKPEPLRLDDHDDRGLSEEGRHQATLLRNRLTATAELAAYLVAIERAARAFVDAILANEGKTIVIVTQTVPLRASLWAFLSLPFHASYLDLEITGTGITEWVADGWLPGTGQMKARLVRYNDHAHLRTRAWST